MSKRTLPADFELSGGPRRRYPKDHYTILIICPLSIEAEAMVAMLDVVHEPHPINRQRRSDRYTLGEIGVHFVAVATLPTTGNTSATAVAGRAREAFQNLELIFLVGVAAGIQRLPDYPVKLGDVVISDIVRQYDYGEHLEDGSFRIEDHLNRPPAELVQTTKELLHYRNTQRVLSVIEGGVMATSRFAPPSAFISKSPVVSDTTEDQCSGSSGGSISRDDHTSTSISSKAHETWDVKIYQGIIASGNKVITHQRTRDEIHSKTRAICIDMEAAGIANDFEYITIRGICDMADERRNKQWRGFASLVAAATTKVMLEIVPLSEQEERRRKEDEGQLPTSPTSGTRILSRPEVDNETLPQDHEVQVRPPPALIGRQALEAANLPTHNEASCTVHDCRDLLKSYHASLEPLNTSEQAKSTLDHQVGNVNIMTHAFRNQIYTKLGSLSKCTPERAIFDIYLRILEQRRLQIVGTDLKKNNEEDIRLEKKDSKKIGVVPGQQPNQLDRNSLVDSFNDLDPDMRYLRSLLDDHCQNDPDYHTFSAELEAIAQRELGDDIFAEFEREDSQIPEPERREKVVGSEDEDAAKMNSEDNINDDDGNQESGLETVE